MIDLVVWLRQHLDEDERIAKAATAGPWRHNSDKHWRKPGTSWFEEAVFAGPTGAEAICVAGTGQSDDPQSMADAEHIARHDPARVLRDVEAKRWRLDRHEPRHYDDGTSECSHCLETGDDKWPCDEIRADLATYADRPGYREEWKP